MSPDEHARNRMQAMGKAINASIPPGWGFFLMVFPFEDREGRANYVSDGKREQIIQTMKEFIARSEKSFGTHEGEDDAR